MYPCGVEFTCKGCGKLFTALSHSQKRKKNCPFCGSEENSIKNKAGYSGIVYYVECTVCESCGPLAINEEDARIRWNIRASTRSREPIIREFCSNSCSAQYHGRIRSFRRNTKNETSGILPRPKKS